MAQQRRSLLFAACAWALAGAVKRSVVCVGDSITEGSHSSNESFTYPAQLQVRLDLALAAAKYEAPYEVVNLGLSGATAQRDGDKPYWSTPQYAALSSRSWDVAIVMLGTNDAKSENWNASNYARDLGELVLSIRARTKLLAIPPPLMEDGVYDDMSQDVVDAVLPELVPAVAGVVDCDAVVDVFRALGGRDDWEDAFPADGCAVGSDFGPCIYFCSQQSCDQCHPNDVGYARLAEAMAHAVLGLSHSRRTAQLRESRLQF